MDQRRGGIARAIDRRPDRRENLASLFGGVVEFRLWRLGFIKSSPVRSTASATDRVAGAPDEIWCQQFPGAALRCRSRMTYSPLFASSPHQNRNASIDIVHDPHICPTSAASAQFALATGRAARRSRRACSSPRSSRPAAQGQKARTYSSVRPGQPAFESRCPASLGRSQFCNGRGASRAL
jgi:hypothetical protein